MDSARFWWTRRNGQRIPCFLEIKCQSAGFRWFDVESSVTASHAENVEHLGGFAAFSGQIPIRQVYVVMNKDTM
jgi:hypothetical protein